MVYFDKNKKFGNRRDFSSRGGDRQMYQAVCSNCGRNCSVPFKPTGAKPIFCSECFEKNNEGFNQNRFASRDQRRPQGGRELEEINTKLDRILGLLEATKTSRN